MSTLRKHLQPLAAILAATVGLMPAALLAPAVALASSNTPAAGVHIDPSSPAAKEYALPLAIARGAPASTGSDGSLFGSGIRDNSKGGGATQSDETRPAPKHPATPPPADSRGQTGVTAHAAPTAFRILHPSAGTSWLWMLLPAVFVLALGGAGALLLSRGRYRGSGPYPN